MLNEQTIFNIAETLNLLAKRINQESGNKIMIMFSMQNGDDQYTGGVKQGDINWDQACKMAVSMTNYIGEQYGHGNLEE